MEARVKWIGLVLWYFLLRTASKIWVYNNGLVHLEFCLTRGDLKFFHNSVQLQGADRSRADTVGVNFKAFKPD